ncbi:Arylsulfotransferase-domain-containing protein [Xylariaceae sp. FL0804]|nr:Arylsulfotransferase-domain-containing protein [Xylariaceae sp. FL0804]
MSPLARAGTWPICALLLLLLGACEVRAHDVFQSRYLYDLGYYGFWPQTQYKSFPLKSPLLNFPQWDEAQCGDDGLYTIGLKGKLVNSPGPMIIDSRGDLVWADDRYGTVTDLKVQEYRGKLYLTFWASPDGSHDGFGRGSYYMLDSSYEIFSVIEPVGEGLKGDLHDFHIMPDGTALMTAYAPVPADLTSVGGPAKGWALDGRFQEVDIETGELVFEWSAIDHVPVADTLRYFMGPDDGSGPESAFDYYHINSLEKDADGNYLVSGRHTHTIHCIDRNDGHILWTLGGRQNEFRDLSGGQATDFTWQHHVRLHDNNTLSIFDNAKIERWGPAEPHDYTRGMMVRLDTEQKTAELEQAYYNPDNHLRPDSQGSMQVLDDRVIMGYGWYPAITEFSRESGEILCDVRIAPGLVSRWGLVTTYRAFKTRDWVATPLEPPAVFLKPSEGRMYVSWNGATQVRSWRVQGAEWDDLKKKTKRRSDDAHVVDDDDEARFEVVLNVPKDGFETIIEMDGAMPQYLRIAAVDADGEVLGHTAVVDRFVGNAPSHFVRTIIIVVVAVVVTVVGAAVLFLLVRKRGIRGVKRGSIHAVESLARLVVPRRLRPVRLGDSSTHPEEDAEDRSSRRPQYSKPSRWWDEWRSAGTHELQPLYED